MAGPVLIDTHSERCSCDHLAAISFDSVGSLNPFLEGASQFIPFCRMYEWSSTMKDQDNLPASSLEKRESLKSVKPYFCIMLHPASIPSLQKSVDPWEISSATFSVSMLGTLNVRGLSTEFTVSKFIHISYKGDTWWFYFESSQSLTFEYRCSFCRNLFKLRTYLMKGWVSRTLAHRYQFGRARKEAPLLCRTTSNYCL